VTKSEIDKATLRDAYRAIGEGRIQVLLKLFASNNESLDQEYLADSLHLAVRKGHLQIVKELVNHGADVNSLEYGGGPIGTAASEGHVDIMKYLLEHGANLDVSSPSLNPLFDAIYGGQCDSVRFLLESGIDANVVYRLEGGQLRNAISFAKELGQTEIVDLLTSAGCRLPVDVGTQPCNDEGAHEPIQKHLIQQTGVVDELAHELSDALDKQLLDSLSRHGLLEHQAVIRARARLTYLLRVSPVDDPNSVPIGASRLGGTPDLPTDMEWARNPDDDLLLDFIGQINFSDVPTVGTKLPKSGLLLIYSQQEGAAENTHTTQFVDCSTASLVRADVPDEDDFSDCDTDEPYGTLVITEFIPSVSLPHSANECGEFGGELYEAYSELVEELHSDPAQNQETSRLLGHPYSPYGSILPNEDWELLIQVESHFHAGTTYMNFWDAGCLQILVKSSDLPNCRFSQSRACVFSN